LAGSDYPMDTKFLTLSLALIADATSGMFPGCKSSMTGSWVVT